MSSEIAFSVSDFVAVFNQTINYAYPSVTIVGELANFRVSKNRWVYFDLKDETASVKFFGTVYQLQGPLEEGMMLTVRGTPQLHPLYGFSITIQSIQLTGEGTLKRAAQLLEAKLRTEGLFDTSRKRSIIYPPQTIGLITSSESAAYVDFIKILNERWSGVEVQLYDVQVQGENAPGQIIEALEYFNSHANPPEVLVVTRGGGSADDLQAFSTEQVTRAIAASRIPTLVAIGHEVDISLAELAADYRASTPSNAAQVLVPDRKEVKSVLASYAEQLAQAVQTLLTNERREIADELQRVGVHLAHELHSQKQSLGNIRQLLELLHPKAILSRGYAIVRSSGKVVRSVKQASEGAELTIQLQDGSVLALVKGKVQ
jgi:exodeoxyribonuclease VII large subunit